ncbi:hypothetical protein XI04_32855 [Bradyrhizobium sp. CCBAU 11430]|nr:hypothetical protein [Bradyrhizobium sp. CCBAU 21360]MDA9458530.1 hypothetical protein [Bradyrhizobium sp. CCBAU 21359]MDA9517799.1 hypothetical protein [Bradyrhizobium sp. CCBAU 11430]
MRIEGPLVVALETSLDFLRKAVRRSWMSIIDQGHQRDRNVEGLRNLSGRLIQGLKFRGIQAKAA